MNNNLNTKECFIITPIGDELSETRRKADGVIKSVIEPVLKEMGITPVVPHELANPGPIGDDIINRILNSYLCIANLTGLNPNVIYELAVRHAANRPIVCIAENETILPFDLANERVIFYSNDMRGVTDLMEKLRDYIETALTTTQLNPITHAKRDFKITEVQTTLNESILDKIEILSSYIQYLASGKYSITPKNTYYKKRQDNSETYYICTEHEAFLYNLKERGYKIKVLNNSYLDFDK